MNTRELIEILQRHDPRGECTVRIDVEGIESGIGDPFARYPTVEGAFRGFDWSHHEFVLRPNLKLSAAPSEERHKQP